MKHLSIALTALMLLSVPASAQTLSVLLPSITFPTDDVTASTKGCATATTGAPVCIHQE